MCTVSDYMKFCTCSNIDVTELNHYWILHRKSKGKNQMLIGEPIAEHYKLLSDFETNNKTLCNRLNEKDAFDKPIKFKENDHFEIVFNNIDLNKERTIHCFIYKNGKWITTNFDSFDLINKFDEIDTGTLENTY